MDYSTLAMQIYEFMLKNEAYSPSEMKSPVAAIKGIEDDLSDVVAVQELMKEIDEISDYFTNHETYITEAKPLLTGLAIIRANLEDAQRKRMVSDTGYEVKNAIHIGDKEILFAVDEKAADGMAYFVGDYTENEILGEYSSCQVSNDFLEAMEEFTDRVSKQIEAMREEVKQIGLPPDLFTAEHCYSNDYKKSIDGKVVAIRADVFRPEYRRGDVQLVLVNGGNGARAEPMGRTIYCYHLNDGKHTRFYRSDVQGEVKPECLPEWAEIKAAAIRAENNAPQRNLNDRERGEAR